MTDETQTPDETPAESPPETTEQPAEPVEPTPEEEEAEEAEEGAEGQPEPQALAPPAVEGLSEKELERRAERIGRANVTYVKKLGEIMEQDFALLEACPRCVPGGFFGHYFTGAPIEPEQKAAVLLSVGEEAPKVSERDSYSRRCEQCDGWGKVLSGSRLNQEKTLVCIACKGRGWVAVGDERRVPSQAVTEPAPVNGAPEFVEQPPDADPWGRTPNDPDYGKLPQYVGRS
jgi:hypothetical protein